MSLVPNPNAFIPAAAGLGILLLALSGSLAIIGNSKTMSKEKLTRSMIALGIMSGVIVILAGVLTGLSFLPNPESLVPSAVALSTLMLALSGVLVILSYVGDKAKNAKNGIIALTAMVIPLAVFAAALAFLPDLSGKERSIAVLAITMAAMTVLLLALVGIGAIMKLVGAGGVAGAIIGLTAMVIPLAAFGVALALLPDLSGKSERL